MTLLCRYCGKTEDEHCFTFVPVMPDGCQCDYGSWRGAANIRPACAQYVGNGEQYCATCEHDKACHKEPK